MSRKLVTLPMSHQVSLVQSTFSKPMLHIALFSIYLISLIILHFKIGSANLPINSVVA